jgi:uncharacterized protein YkwD
MFSAPTVRLPLLACTAIAAACLLPASAQASPGGCASAAAQPHAARYVVVRDATLCLINAERRRRGLPRLRFNRRLAKAAVRHARDMARHDYFAHDSRDGRNFVDRIRRSGYIRRSSGGWALGENLAWGSGSLASPRAIVRAWMNSPGHRSNILNRRFREIGVAHTLDAPVAGATRAATYVTDFGAR